MYFKNDLTKSTTEKNGQHCKDNYKANSLYLQEVRSCNVIVATMTSLVLIIYIIIIAFSIKLLLLSKLLCELVLLVLSTDCDLC